MAGKGVHVYFPGDLSERAKTLGLNISAISTQALRRAIDEATSEAANVSLVVLSNGVQAFTTQLEAINVARYVNAVVVDLPIVADFRETDDD